MAASPTMEVAAARVHHFMMGRLQRPRTGLREESGRELQTEWGSR